MPETGVAMSDKVPRTERGRRTLRALLDAAADEFGERGFHEAGIVRIAQRAGVAIGSFYTYFDSKESIFRALVIDMSRQVRETVGPRMAAASDRLEGERVGVETFIAFVRQHKALYRIIDEADFVAPDAYRAHYDGIAAGYRASLDAAVERGELAPGDNEIRAWALMGINVMIGLRFGLWAEDRDPAEVANVVAELVRRGMGPA